MIDRSCVRIRKTALPLVVLVMAVSVRAAPKHTLLLNGHSTDVPVIYVSGHPYVGLEALAKALNGSMSTAHSSTGSVVGLSMPSSPDNGETASTAPARSSATMSTAFTAQAPVPANQGFSRGFMTAGIEAMSALREWHSALQTTIQSGFPLSAAVVDPYRAEATKDLRLASVAATTSADRSGYHLLEHEYQNMAKLSDKYVSMRANLNYIAPDALQNDELNQRVVSCGRFLATMTASGQFSEDRSCQ